VSGTADREERSSRSFLAYQSQDAETRRRSAVVPPAGKKESAKYEPEKKE